MAIGGSTNTALHLPAIAQAAAVPLTVADFEAAGDVPTLLAVSPNGPYGITEFYMAGGIPAVLKRLEDDLHGDALTVTGRTVAALAAALGAHGSVEMREALTP